MREVTNYAGASGNHRARLTGAAGNANGNGSERGECGCGQRSHRASDPAPISPDFGITSYELAEYIRSFARWCAQRVEGPGMVEYDRGSHQKFEVMTPQELIQGLQEELADAANYISMISLHIGRLAKSLPDKDERNGSDMGSAGSSDSLSRQEVC